MKPTRILLLLTTIAGLSACGESELKLSADRAQMVSEQKTEAPANFIQYPDDNPSILDGKGVFEKQNCAGCHGAAGAGGSALALNDASKLTLKKPVDIYLLLAYGKGPNHKPLGQTLSNRDIWNLVFYSRSLSAPPLSAAEIKTLDPVFGSNCAVCHGTKGDGDGPLAHNLEPAPANFQTFARFFDRTDDLLYDHIANGIKWEGMPNFLGKEDKKKDFKFDEANIKKLVQYVRHFHVTNEPPANAPQAASPTPTPEASTGGTKKGSPASATGTSTQAPSAGATGTSTQAPAAGATGSKGASSSAASATQNIGAPTESNATAKPAEGYPVPNPPGAAGASLAGSTTGRKP